MNLLKTQLIEAVIEPICQDKIVGRLRRIAGRGVTHPQATPGSPIKRGRRIAGGLF